LLNNSISTLVNIIIKLEYSGYIKIPIKLLLKAIGLAMLKSSIDAVTSYIEPLLNIILIVGIRVT
jgi:phosphoglycerol transferase MdoB-like AlkP superfamily enzyme